MRVRKRREGALQPYIADLGSAIYYPRPDSPGIEIWCVRGGDYKGFGRIPVFAGTKAQCLAVAKALNEVEGLEPKPEIA